jgi:two-component system chemotaxis response regulator CheB
MPELKYIIVIGASAGGFHAVSKLASMLPPDLNAAVLVVLHVSRNSSVTIIREHIQKQTGLVCKIAKNEDTISAGHIYIAPADHHLLVAKGNKIIVNKGVHENRWRPSIDVLFRSAANAYNSRVIGIVLSGLLDDGTSGMYAIKQSGGTCIVQEPAEAEFPDMPNSVLRSVDVDYRIPLTDMAYVLDDIMSKAPKEAVAVPEQVKVEAEIGERMSSSMQDVSKLGELTPFVCPDCGGSLWHLKEGRLDRYRCYTGHVYTENILLDKQIEKFEDAIWVAIRMLEERNNLLMAAASHDHSKTDKVDKEDRIAKLKMHINRLKELLMLVHQSEHKNGTKPSDESSVK